MKKSILALTLVAALSMLGACSSDDNGGSTGSTGISGNFAKEPIKDAKLQLWELDKFKKADASDAEKIPAGEATTLTDGSFNFPNADPAKVYVVSIAPNGLDNAILMNKADGTPVVVGTTPAGLTANSAIIVPVASPALLNPIGIAATTAAGIDLTGPLTDEQIAGAGALVGTSITTIVTNLTALTNAADFNVNPATLLSAGWSPELEVALQLATHTAGVSFANLASPTFELSDAIISAAIAARPAAVAAANAAGAATGKGEATPDVIDTKAIVRTFLFNGNATNPVLLPAQLNASNGTYVVDGKAFGANASLNLEIAKKTLKIETTEGQAKLIPAKSIDATTVTESDKGITAQTGKTAPAFAYDVVKVANGTYTATVRAGYDNNQNTENTIVFNVNSSLKNVNATFFKTK